MEASHRNAQRSEKGISRLRLVEDIASVEVLQHNHPSLSKGVEVGSSMGVVCVQSAAKAVALRQTTVLPPEYRVVRRLPQKQILLPWLEQN